MVWLVHAADRSGAEKPGSSMVSKCICNCFCICICIYICICICIYICICSQPWHGWYHGTHKIEVVQKSRARAEWCRNVLTPPNHFALAMTTLYFPHLAHTNTDMNTNIDTNRNETSQPLFPHHDMTPRNQFAVTLTTLCWIYFPPLPHKFRYFFT